LLARADKQGWFFCQKERSSGWKNILIAEKIPGNQLFI